MKEHIFAVTGDTHGEEGRFWHADEAVNRHLHEGDYLFICGDFGYIFDNSEREKKFLDYLAEKIPYTICFCDGNHENFEVLNSYEVTRWNGGKIHAIRSDITGNPKVIHLMRGQIYDIKGTSIFVFGGANSIDKAFRQEGKSWWPEEMPNKAEMDEAIANLERVGWKVDYIITHAAPEESMSIFHPDHIDEKPLNNFLEYIRERTQYKHWYLGHLHRDEDIWRHQTILWFSLRNMEDASELV